VHPSCLAGISPEARSQKNLPGIPFFGPSGMEAKEAEQVGCNIMGGRSPGPHPGCVRKAAWGRSGNELGRRNQAVISAAKRIRGPGGGRGGGGHFDGRPRGCSNRFGLFAEGEPEA